MKIECSICGTSVDVSSTFDFGNEKNMCANCLSLMITENYNPSILNGMLEEISFS